MRNNTVFYPTPTNFVVRTYVNPKLLRPEQHESVREMEAWLAAHQAEDEAAVMQYHRHEENDQDGFLDSASWAPLAADFQAYTQGSGSCRERMVTEGLNLVGGGN